MCARTFVLREAKKITIFVKFSKISLFKRIFILREYNFFEEFCFLVNIKKFLDIFINVTEFLLWRNITKNLDFFIKYARFSVVREYKKSLEKEHTFFGRFGNLR